MRTQFAAAREHNSQAMRNMFAGDMNIPTNLRLLVESMNRARYRLVLPTATKHLVSEHLN
jgi:hypothetical protein